MKWRVTLILGIVIFSIFEGLYFFRMSQVYLKIAPHFAYVATIYVVLVFCFLSMSIINNERYTKKFYFIMLGCSIVLVFMYCFFLFTKPSYTSEQAQNIIQEQEDILIIKKGKIKNKSGEDLYLVTGIEGEQQKTYTFDPYTGRYNLLIQR